ncbi:MAG TPA: CRISPR-associated helicase Cas3', partial [Phycisphaerales bacterium]|nr:CRISPR-associated helicase Cas3' [Phycisphaerales bacterium]
TLAEPRRYLDKGTSEPVECASIPAGESKSVSLKFTSTNLDDLTALFKERLNNGGCAAVVCNTVDRSIEIFKHFKDNLQEAECILFHARTLKMWRRKREEEVLLKFGKGSKQADGTYINPQRPKRAVLVATQVIEQSLDLDFDLMVSEIAPIDLLLQRAGRLQRHTRLRPQGLESPHFIILCDARRDGPPPESFGKSIEYVYDRYILLQTWLVLRQKEELRIPAEIEGLIEEVYGEQNAVPETWSPSLEQARQRMEHERTESEKAADRLLVSEPKDPTDLIEKFNEQLADDENPEVHKSVRAATREGNPSVTVVMLPADWQLSSEPGITEVRKLLDRSVAISNKGLFQMLVDQKAPKEWSKSAHLRHARLLRLDEQNCCRFEDYILEVNKEIGVSIAKEERSNV